MTMFSELSRPQRIRFTKLSPSARREARLGFLFISPWIIGFLAFTLIPLVASLVFSFTNLTLTQEEPLKFGLESYQLRTHFTGRLVLVWPRQRHRASYADTCGI